MAEYKTDAQKKKFYKSAAWSGKNGIRLQALKRDNNECQMCKKLGHVHADSIKVQGERKRVDLNVHHIQEIEHHPALALRLDNLQTLCIDHHNEVHGRMTNKKEIKWQDEKW